MSEWRETTLGEVLDVLHGFAFKGEHFSVGGDARVVTPGNFFEAGGFRDRGSEQKSYEGPTPAGYVLDAGEIVVAMTEQAAGLLGSAGIVPTDGAWLHNQRIGRVQILDGAADLRFVYYLFNSPDVRSQIAATATGAKVRHTAPERLRAVVARMPTVSAQRRVAAVLAAFDELIATNGRRIDMLERLVRSLYREWFVAQATSSRTQPPERETTTIDAVAERHKGSISPARLPVIVEHFSMPAFDAGRLPAQQLGGEIKSAKTPVSGPTVLLSKLNPRIPRVWFACPETDHAVTSTEFLAWHGREVSNAWLWSLFSSDEFRRQLVGTAGGTSTSHQRIKPDDVARYRIAVPRPNDLLRFDEIAEPSLHETVVLRRANRALARTRDLLLPRLVTGRLDISDVDLGALTPAETA